MNIKHVSLIVVFIAIVGNALSQTHVGVKAGINFSNVIWREFSGNRATKLTNGFNLGIITTSPIKVRGNPLFIQPGLFFSKKGFRENYEDEISGSGNFIVTPFYIEMPVNLLYLIPNKSDKNVFVGIGPYAAVGIGGDWEVKFNKGGNYVGGLEYKDINNQTPPQININDDKFNYGKRVDYGVNFLIGYELLERIQIQLNGQMGLKNIAPKKNGKNTSEYFKNYVFGFSIGYTL